MHADYALDPSKEDVRAIVAEKTGGLGVDVVLEMAGHPDAIRAAFDIIRRGGRISLLGLTSKPIPLNFSEDIIFKGITDSRYQRPPHVSDLVSDDSPAQKRTARSSSRDHRSHSDERFL